MDPNRRQTPLLVGLALAIVVLLVAGLAFWTARRPDDGPDNRAGGGWVGRVGGEPGDTAPATAPPANPEVAQQPAPANAPLVEVIRAASADYIGTIEAVTSVRFTADAATGSISGKVTDAAGADLGQGTLRLGAGPTAFASPAITLDGQIDVDGNGVVLTEVTVTAARGPLAIEGRGLVFQPMHEQGKPPPPERNLGDTKVTVTDGATAVDLGEGKRWDDAPPELRLRDKGRSTLSWAGGAGRVVGPNREPITATKTLGVKADGLAGTITRTNQGLTIRAEGRLRQAYADALPRIPARGRVDVKTTPAPLAAGAKGRFTWAPTNTTDYDLAISRIRPGNDHGSWVNLALDHLPMMCGRPTCDRHGGVTDGLGKKGSGGFLAGGAKRINCVILPGTGDERDITFDVPAGTPPGDYNLVLVLEGNFEPITVTVPVTVTP